MAGKGRGGKDGATIVLKRVEEGGHGHHGGAWKVAYADFVTAMMAFFLLMWLLNATSEDQRRGIADFFAPSNVLGQRATGSGLPFGGRTPNSDGPLVSDSGAVQVRRGTAPLRLDIDEEEEETTGEADALRPGQGEGQVPGPGQPAARAARMAEADAEGPDGAAAESAADAAARAEAMATLDEAALQAELARREHAALAQAAEEMRSTLREDPALAELARQLTVEVVPEGLRIQLLDADRAPMFALGSAAPNERARLLLQAVARIANRLPNGLAIAGHTDAAPFRAGGGAGAEGRSNWELSADRANAVRRLLTEAGIAEGRIRSVTGHAARQPLLPDQPLAAGNRRVAITLLRDLPGAEAPAAAATPPAPAAAPAPAPTRRAGDLPLPPPAPARPAGAAAVAAAATAAR